MKKTKQLLLLILLMTMMIPMACQKTEEHIDADKEDDYEIISFERYDTK